MAKSVLGKGLDALIPKKVASTESPKEFTYLALEDIVLSRYQPRQEIEASELEDLARSIKQKGFIQPIVVRRVGKSHEIVAGWRRYQAANSLGLKEIPTIIKDLDDKDAFVLAIVENLQRKDLNAIEEAEAFKRLMDEFSFGVDDIAKFVGKDRSTIANSLRLLKLPNQIKEALRKGLINRTQAKTILGLSTSSAQEKMFLTIQSEGLSVREIEKKVRRAAKRPAKIDPNILEVEERLQKLLGTKVRIMSKRNSRGKVVIEYYSLDDLDRILGRLE